MKEGEYKIRKTIILSNIRELLLKNYFKIYYPYHQPWKDWALQGRETGVSQHIAKRPLTEPMPPEKASEDRQTGRRWKPLRSKSERRPNLLSSLPVQPISQVFHQFYFRATPCHEYSSHEGGEWHIS